ncbi:MAG: cupin domain-containing protein [Pseudomonadota bacterium]
MERKPAKKSLSEIAIEEAHGGAGSRQVIFSKSDPFVSPRFEAMTKGFLPSGAAYDWHKHDGVDELFLVISGSGVIRYEGGTSFDYKPGDVFYSPAGIPHRIENTSPAQNEFYFIRINA